MRVFETTHEALTFIDLTFASLFVSSANSTSSFSLSDFKDSIKLNSISDFDSLRSLVEPIQSITYKLKINNKSQYCQFQLFYGSLGRD